MKKLILTLFILIVSCSKPINESTLIKRGELLYEPNATKLFTGKVFDLYENGQKTFEGNYKDGFKQGEWIYYTKTGNGSYRLTYNTNIYNFTEFKDSIGNVFRGIPTILAPKQDSEYLYQSNEVYDFSIYPKYFTKFDGEKYKCFNLKGELISLIDIDGNEYATVIIGDQEWMAENLKVTHYNNRDPITYIINNGDWGSYDEGQYGVYDNDPSYADTYGNLYNWAVVNDDREVCPVGWHVPTDDEWKEIEMAFDMSQSEADDTGWRGNYEGSKLAGNANLWYDSYLESKDEFGTSGFNALPSGYRSYDNGVYSSIGNGGYF